MNPVGPANAPDPRNRWAAWIALFFCVWAVVSRVWVTEDAYITFRAIENLFAGHGLVFNPGDRVEVFTHPLWMLLLVSIRAIGLPLHIGSIVLGLSFSLGTLAFLVFRRTPAGNRALPVAALALVSISGFRDFATAGMEYSLVFFLLTLLVFALRTEKLRDRPFFYSGLLAALYLTRPELALLAVYYSAFFAFELLELDGRELFYKRDLSALAGRVLRKGLPWLVGFVLVAGSYHLFRAFYYGDIFPNTYYAKAGLSSYFSQGWKYLALTLLWSPALWLLAIWFFITMAWRRLRAVAAPRLHFETLRELGAAVLVTVYVVRVGGDFMAFRFLLAPIMLAVLALQRLMDAFPMGQGRPWLRLALPALALVLSFFPVPPSSGVIADERQQFVEGETLVTLWTSSEHRWGRTGHRFGEFARCLGVEEMHITNSITQARCMQGIGLGYFGVNAGPQVWILDEQGLPNRDVATSPVLFRWRPGHEHYIDLNHVVRSRSWFCSSGEPAFDRVMATPIGILISLDPAVLSTVPDVRSRLAALVRLKNAGSVIVPMLETEYGVRVEELERQAVTWQADPLLTFQHRCWRNSWPPDRERPYPF